MSTPAGWFSQMDGQLRYWDGEGWTEYFAPGAGPGKALAGGAATNPPAQAASLAARKNWFRRHKVITAIGVVLLLAMFPNPSSGGATETVANVATESSARPAAPAASSDGTAAAARQAAADKAAADQAVADKAVADKAVADQVAADKVAVDQAAADEAAAAKNGPKDQQAFVKAVIAGRAGYEDTDNELKQRQIQRTRDRAVCAAVPHRKVANWVGEIKSLDTNGEGKAVLELEIGEGTKVSTWNNAFSDVSDRTLISMDSPMYTTLVGLVEGESIRFSGTFIAEAGSCLGEQSLTLYGKMKTPSFTFRFSKVKAI